MDRKWPACRRRAGHTLCAESLGRQKSLHSFAASEGNKACWIAAMSDIYHSLNPILRVNKSASTSPTSTVRAPDSPKMRKIPFNVKAPKPSTSTSNDVVDVSSMSGNYAGPSSPRQSTFATDSSSIYSDRSRKSSTDSLRKYLDRATSPSPSSTSAPSLRPSKIPKR